MPITPKPFLTVPFADEATPFDVTLAVPATAEDLVSVPGSKKGRIVSLVNEGPGAAAIVFAATAIKRDGLLVMAVSLLYGLVELLRGGVVLPF